MWSSYCLGCFRLNYICIVCYCLDFVFVVVVVVVFVVVVVVLLHISRRSFSLK